MSYDPDLPVFLREAAIFHDREDPPRNNDGQTMREAADEIDRLTRIVWQFQRTTAIPAPCRICGYNGPNFWQPNAHWCARLTDPFTASQP